MSDLISREDAIQTFIAWGLKEFGYHDLNRNERFIDAIEALPSASSVRFLHRESEKDRKGDNSL